MTKSHKKYDIRCKGTKTDQDLLDEYFMEEWHCSDCNTTFLVSESSWYINKCCCGRLPIFDIREAIEKELGKDRIEKERMERRFKSLEDNIKGLKSIQVYQERSIDLDHSEVMIQRLWGISIFLIVLTSMLGAYKII